MDAGVSPLISDQSREKLNHLLSALTSEQSVLIDHIKNEVLLNIPQYFKMTDFRKPVKKVEAIFLKKAVHHSQEEQTVLKRAMVAKLALNLPRCLEKMNLPTSVLVLYPDALERLVDFLKTAAIDRYDSAGEFFCKDVRFVLGLSVPCGSRIVDLNSRIYLHTVILSVIRARNMDGLIRYFRAGGAGPWLRSHVESRYLEEYNQQGTDNYYLRLADLLEKKKDIKGWVGSAWLLDPQLMSISPRLAYLRERPLGGGAFFLKHGTKSSDIANAIKTSEKRRCLYQAGKYIPVCYSVVWPRNELIAWADKTRRLIKPN